MAEGNLAINLGGAEENFVCEQCDADFQSQIELRGHILGKHSRKRPLVGEDHPAWKPINHGTNAGYQQEIRRGLETCEACRRARADYQKGIKKRG